MEERLTRVETLLRQLDERLSTLERRLATIEAAGSRDTSPLAAADDSPSQPRGSIALRPASDLVGLLSLLGRSVIILGGGYLLRALTEGDAIPALTGALLGLLYAGGWLVAAGRTIGGGHDVDGAFHGVTASLIGFPLIWEATVRFGFFSPAVSALALSAFAGVALVQATRGQHSGLAWIATIGTLVTSVALLPATGATLPYALVLLLLGLVTLWLGYVRDWTALRWPVAVALDVVAIGLISRALARPPIDPPLPVIALLLTLAGAYLASTAVRTLVRGRNVIPFEVTQAGLALLVGLGGAIAVGRATQTGIAWLGPMVLASALASYAVAFAFVDRRQGRGANFYFYTSLALVFTLVGSRLVFGGEPGALLNAALACLFTVAGVRFQRIALSLHASIYLIAASLSSGALAQAGRTLFGPPEAAFQVLGPVGWIVVVAAALSAAWRVVTPEDGWGGWTRLPRLVTIVVLAWLAGGASVAVVALWIAATVSRPLTAGEVATIRTVVLSGSALVLAFIAPRRRVPEAGWLVYPVLFVAGANLVGDLRVSKASQLVVALGAYGAALIAAPRLLRKHDELSVAVTRDARVPAPLRE